MNFYESNNHNIRANFSPKDENTGSVALPEGSANDGVASYQTSSTLDTSQIALLDQYISRRDQLVCSSNEENKLLKAENQEINQKNQEINQKYELLSCSVSDILIERQKDQITIKDLKAKLEEAQETIKNLELGITPSETHVFEFLTEDFGDKVSRRDIIQLFGVLLALVNEKDSNGHYIINSRYDVYIIFAILKQDVDFQRKYGFKASDSRLCKYWNNNIVAMLNDNNRKKQLKCSPTSYGNFKSTNKESLRQNSISWRSLSISGGHNQDFFQRASYLLRMMKDRLIQSA